MPVEGVSPPMSSTAGGPGSEVSPSSGPSYDDRLLVHNEGDSPVELTIVRQQGDAPSVDTVRAEPGATYGVPMPDRDGSTLVEVHCERAMATTSVDPGAHPPLFTCDDGAVLVDRE
jgi:hypothetical protein